MIILHIIPTCNPEYGGPIEGIFTSAPALRAQGCDREIVSLDMPTDPWVKTSPVRVYPMGNPSPAYHAWKKRIPFLRYGYSPAIVPWIRENAKRYDAVIVNGLWNFASLAARQALVGTDTRYFVYAHGMLDPYFNKISPVKAFFKQLLWWASEGRLINNATSVMFVTKEERELAKTSFWPYRARARVVPYGIVDVSGDAEAQIKSFRAALPQLGERRFLLFLSRIHPKKGCDILVEAFAKMAGGDPDLDLVIAGPDSVGAVKELQEVAAQRGVADRIHWPGMLKGDLKWGAFRACDGFILPSHQENFGIVIAEALACGKPVLTTDKVATWREVADNNAGFVENDDLPGVTRLIEHFLSLSPLEKQEMSKRARATYLTKFDMGSMAPELIEAFRTSQAA
ncbi:glycosyl transferase group 1 [Methylocella silvestris BL2]|uniref:Glycosyl transferase group 1 n=1 Tax=Methylocella silvestris (strain DSM 15510 / CIP 108128 / LMG 27833 / NCIMB 13906 / BL2) TaxID=395965 RepID=B8EP72_METSB|nr:glycosyltransferase [Methylocella silvestris]ACK49660.1 glycosyl transferase group 1 [Methylocella silvestris BL2]